MFALQERANLIDAGAQGELQHMAIRMAADHDPRQRQEMICLAQTQRAQKGAISRVNDYKCHQIVTLHESGMPGCLRAHGKVQLSCQLLAAIRRLIVFLQEAICGFEHFLGCQQFHAGVVQGTDAELARAARDLLL